MTMDFQRDYDFVFSLYYNPINTVKRAKSAGAKTLEILKTITATATLLYVSQLAHEVTPPSLSLETEGIELLNLGTPVPRKLSLENITVKYFDDNAQTVYNFHRGWFEGARDGLTFELFPLVTLSMVFMPTWKTPAGRVAVPIGVSPVNFPQVFPVKISRSAFDRKGSSLSEVDVTYIRVPKIKMQAGLLDKAVSFVKNLKF